MNIDEIEERLNRISRKLEEEKKEEKKREEENEYRIVNDAYKRYISQYSKEYIEMSDYYYGPELPYEVYIKEFKNGDTYLDTGKDVKELYSLFIYFMFFDLYTRNDHLYQ